MANVLKNQPVSGMLSEQYLARKLIKMSVSIDVLKLVGVCRRVVAPLTVRTFLRERVLYLD